MATHRYCASMSKVKIKQTSYFHTIKFAKNILWAQLATPSMPDYRAITYFEANFDL
jgi:hypothetical protein